MDITVAPPPLDRPQFDEHRRTGLHERPPCFDRQATLERVIAHVAHSLGNPLNVIEGRAAIIAAGHVPEAEVQRNARIIGEQSSRIVRFLRDAVSSVQRERSSTSTHIADVGAIVSTVLAMFAPIAEARGVNISVEWETGSSTRVRGDPGALIVLVTHLVENGIRMTPASGTLRVRIRHEVEEAHGSRGAPAPFVCVDVEDDGPGIVGDVPRRSFTTTPSDAGAVRLGLFIAEAIAKEQGGWLEGGDQPTRGARFTVHLPDGRVHAP